VNDDFVSVRWIEERRRETRRVQCVVNKDKLTLIGIASSVQVEANIRIGTMIIDQARGTLVIVIMNQLRACCYEEEALK
jgi:hypothetical protein